MRLRNVKDAKKIVSESNYVINDPESIKGHFSELFGNDNEIHLEIGMGKGDFIIGNALKYPNINFIGMEKYESVMVRAIEKLNDLKLDNLKLIRYDATYLDRVFDHEITTLYLNFSDPWKKRRQAKRRLTHKNFLDVYKKVLKYGDLICFKTDNRNLFEFSLNSFAAENYKLSNITFDLHNSEFEDNVMTEYEAKFSELGMPIYRLEAAYFGWK